MKRGDKILLQAPKGCCDWLTAGKVYEGTVKKTNTTFNVTDDEGGEISCYFENSIHLNGQDWIIVDKPKDNSLEKEINIAKRELLVSIIDRMDSDEAKSFDRLSVKVKELQKEFDELS